MAMTGHLVSLSAGRPSRRNVRMRHGHTDFIKFNPISNRGALHSSTNLRAVAWSLALCGQAAGPVLDASVSPVVV